MFFSFFWDHICSLAPLKSIYCSWISIPNVLKQLKVWWQSLNRHLWMRGQLLTPHYIGFHLKILLTWEKAVAQLDICADTGIWLRMPPLLEDGSIRTNDSTPGLGRRPPGSTWFRLVSSLLSTFLYTYYKHIHCKTPQLQIRTRRGALWPEWAIILAPVRILKAN